MEHLPGHIRGIVAREEQITRRDFFRLTDSFHRNLGAKSFDLLFGESGRNKRGPDWSRSDGIDTNILLG
jgi:hypothetical protein